MSNRERGLYVRSNSNNVIKVKYNGTKIGIKREINCFSPLIDIVVEDLKGTGRCQYVN
jgi:hypothetical protein